MASAEALGFRRTDRNKDWALVAAVLLFDVLVGRLLGFSILSRGWIGIGILVCALAGLSWFYSRWRRIDDGSLAETLEELSILAAYAPVVASLSYVLAAVAMPLVDPQLAELDRLVGLDWPAWYRLVSSFPTLESALALLYRSSLVHIVLLLLALGLLGRRDRARELNMLLITTSFPMVVLSGFLPAQSAWIQYDMGLEKAYHLSQFESLRNGTLRVPRARHATGDRHVSVVPHCDCSHSRLGD